MYLASRPVYSTASPGRRFSAMILSACRMLSPCAAGRRAFS